MDFITISKLAEAGFVFAPTAMGMTRSNREGWPELATSANPARADACVSVDGDMVPCRSALGSVRIVVGEHDVRLMRLDGRDFYSTLGTTFLGA